MVIEVFAGYTQNHPGHFQLEFVRARVLCHHDIRVFGSDSICFKCYFWRRNSIEKPTEKPTYLRFEEEG